jgi:hypothetical protein
VQGGNPFDMKNLMESVKKAQALVQVETQRVQQELARWMLVPSEWWDREWRACHSSGV